MKTTTDIQLIFHRWQINCWSGAWRSTVGVIEWSGLHRTTPEFQSVTHIALGAARCTLAPGNVHLPRLSCVATRWTVCDSIPATPAIFN